MSLPTREPRSDHEPPDLAPALDASRLAWHVRRNTLGIIFIAFVLDARMYGREQVRGTVIHHACRSTGSVRSVAIAMIEASVSASLMSAPRCTDALASCSLPASLATVALPAFAPVAHDEGLAAFLPPTHDATSGELQSRPGPRRKLDAPRELVRSRLPTPTKRGGLQSFGFGGRPFSWRAQVRYAITLALVEKPPASHRDGNVQNSALPDDHRQAAVRSSPRRRAGVGRAGAVFVIGEPCRIDGLHREAG